MSIFGKRNGQSAVELRDLPPAGPPPMRPRPVPVREAPRINPLDPYVATLTSQAIVAAEEHHIAEVDAAIARAEDVAHEMRENFPAWAESRLAQARARAEDVAIGHAEILRCAEAFEAIRSGRLPAPLVERSDPLPDAGPALDDLAESRERLEDLARRLEAARPGGQDV